MITISSQQGITYEYDVIVIGSGLAGLHYCMQVLEHHPTCKVALISKTDASECNSRYAQGGIAAAYFENDSTDRHLQDTLNAGDGLCYEPTARHIVEQAPEAIRNLQNYPFQFSTDTQGEYTLSKEGGHSQRRIFNCGDHTGLTVTSALLKTAQNHQQIHFYEQHIAVNLISQYPPEHGGSNGEVLGAYILDCASGKIHTFLSKAVILATGGAGKTYRYTSNSMVATGDGVAMAYRAGARVGNMEFYQFHPTLLYHPTVNNFLISEAVRGEGALLINPATNQRFMTHYAPEALELATRDVVSRAIFNEIEQSDHGFVYLDITHKSKSFLQKKFPQIFHTLHEIGIDMSQDQIPVVPAAHYQCGGVLTDLHGQTDLKRLYAIGEVAFTGLHGANRLASNSLLEAVVMAQNAARASLSDIQSNWNAIKPIDSWDSPSHINKRRASQINAHWRSLRGEMTSYAGIIRTEAGLEDLLQLIQSREKIIEDYYWHHYITRDFIELRNIILNAKLIVHAALARRESRGGHFREDYPEKNAIAHESITNMLYSPRSFC